GNGKSFCCFNVNRFPGGGGGGVGYTGGGGGGGGSAGTTGCSFNEKGGGGGGGGGSSYTAPLALTSVTPGVQSGNGIVIIRPVITKAVQTQGLVSGSTYPIGTTTNTFTGTDVSSNSATSCTFTITVLAPEVNVQGNSNTVADGSVSTSSSNNTNFGASAICSGSVSKTFTIQNTGTSNLVLTGTSPNYVTIGGTDAASFSVNSQPNVSTIAPNSSALFTVQFTPTTTGLKSAIVNFTSNDCDETLYDFAISGSAIDIYTFTGTGTWTDVSKWSPSYPGTTLPQQCSVLIAGNATIPTTVTVTTGGLFTINNGASLTLASGSNLVIPSTAGTFTNNGTLNISGTFAVNGTVSSPGTINVSGGTVKGNGTIVTPTLSIPAGSFIAPGASPGCLSVGNTTISGTYQVEIAGSTPCTQYDQLNSTGIVTISNATLDLSAYTATPSITNNYTIITANSVVGTFTNVIPPTLSGYCVNVVYTATSVIVKVNAQPNPTFTAFPTSVCRGGGNPNYSYTYTVNPGTVGSNFLYAWNIPSTVTVVSGSINSASVTLRFNAIQAETLACTVTRTDVTPNCSKTISQIVTVNAIPSVFIQGRQQVCRGTETSYATPSAPDQTYQWSISPVHAYTQSDNSITVDWGNPNTYTITCIATNSITGCQNTQAGYTVVVSSNPNPSIVGSTSGCTGQTSTYNVTPV
ncbi:MAG: choice-of-anchor D domain-containing protein, partial [Candidatus Kapabacteria bacterium]|nr:choice-of-anchor D domain-containing protein [Candidatus Kapabacteria bacterium]